MAQLVITPPAAEPVELDAMKRYLRLDASFTQEDDDICEMIAAARQWAEDFTRRAFILQVQRTSLDFFPGYVDEKVARGANVSGALIGGPTAALAGIRYAIFMPYPRVRGIVRFSYLTQPGVWQTLASGTNYVADLQSQPARVTPTFGQVWPVAQVQLGAVQLDYCTGYGGPVPASVSAGSSQLNSSYAFLPEMAGSDRMNPLRICIPGAGANGDPLVTTIASVSEGGVATLADQAETDVENETAWLGDPVPAAIKQSIKSMVGDWYERRLDGLDPNDAVRAALSPYRDLRL